MTTHPTTPDQGDERRAILDALMNNEPLTTMQRSALYELLSDSQPVAQEAITWSPAGYNKELAVDATGKVRGEVCEHSIDPRWDARTNDARLGEYLNRDQAKAAVLAALATPHHPVSAEAGKGEPFGYWHEGPTEDESEFFLAKDLPDNECLRCFPLYRDPTESVAVSGEVSELLAKFDAWFARENESLPVALTDTERSLARYVSRRAVLALAAPMPQAEPDMRAIHERTKADPIDLECETCEGSGKVHQEHQAGCLVGGERQCPDCEGSGDNAKGRALERAYHAAHDAWNGVTTMRGFAEWCSRFDAAVAAFAKESK